MQIVHNILNSGTEVKFNDLTTIKTEMLIAA